jgi:hypothetical protein
MATAKDTADQLGAKWSPDIDDFMAGRIEASAMRCVLCQHSPCDCPPSGTPEYFVLIAKRHGKR